MKLKLTKALSYNGIVRATKKNPYVEVSGEDAKKLLATGYFEAVEEQTAPPVAEAKAVDDSEDEGDEVDYVALSKMTKAELTEYADENEISLEGCKTKDEMLEAISIALGGSSTMIDLQKA